MCCTNCLFVIWEMNIMAKAINIVLKLLIVIVFGYMVIKYVSGDSQVYFDLVLLSNALSERWYLLLSSIVLMPLNWILESQKWRTVMNSYTAVSFRTSIVSILCGITCGLVTPARVGEFMGRLLNVAGEEKKISLYSSFICSLSQNVITLTIGLIASILFVRNISELTITTQQLAIVNSLIIVAVVSLYFFHHRILSLFSNTRFYKNHLHFVRDRTANKSLLYKVLFLSLLRYIVYATQYILILMFLESSVPIFNNVIAVCTIFLIQSSIPLPPLMGLLARGEIAILILGLLSYNGTTALIAAGLLWVINLIIPSLIGLGYLLKMNIWKSLNS